MFTMNTILVKESELEIDAYLNSLSLHQSFEEDDTEDEEFYTANPSGSVLQPTTNPYNKQKKIAEANETLFAEEVSPKSPQKVKFNKVEKRICYDYFGSSFESDSIKSYEDEESEKESVLQGTTKQTNEQPALDIRGTHLQPKTHANKVVVTVTPKKDEDEANSESESEDVCVGTIPKVKDSSVEIKDGKESYGNNEKSDSQNTDTVTKEQKLHFSDEEEANQEQTKKEQIKKEQTKQEQIKKEQTKQEQIKKEQTKQEQIKKEQTKQEQKKKEQIKRSTSPIKEAKIDHIHPKHKESKQQDLEQTSNLVAKKDDISTKGKSEELVFLELEKPSTKCSNNLNERSDFYPCLANHSGITIRITGADSVESVESESTDDEVQLEENYSNSLYNLVEFRPENQTFISKTYQNSRVHETTYKVSKDSFILKGTKSTQNIRSPKQNNKFETGPFQRSQSKREESKKELDVSKTKSEKTEQPVTFKVQKDSYKVAVKPKSMSFKSKPLDNDYNQMTEECCASTKKVRPKSCVEKESAKVKTSSRPLTAPVKRSCCQWGQPHLPEYNGLRSEYGLSAEQLMERKRHKIESLKMQKQRKEQKSKEEQEKRKENEAKFIAWLEDKRKQAQLQFLRNQKIKAESGIKLYPAPTAHLKRTGAVRSRRLFKSQRKCVSLEELLNNASSHEKKTYKIYLGLSFE